MQFLNYLEVFRLKDFDNAIKSLFFLHVPHLVHILPDSYTEKYFGMLKSSIYNPKSIRDFNEINEIHEFKNPQTDIFSLNHKNLYPQIKVPSQYSAFELAILV